MKSCIVILIVGLVIAQVSQANCTVSISGNLNEANLRIALETLSGKGYLRTEDGNLRLELDAREGFDAKGTQVKSLQGIGFNLETGETLAIKKRSQGFLDFADLRAWHGIIKRALRDIPVCVSDKTNQN